MHISQDNRIPVRRANSVRLRKGERVRVHLCSEGRVAERIRQFRDQRLGPDCAGDGASQGGADVVRGEKEGCYDGEVCIEKLVSSEVFVMGWAR